MCGEGGAVFRAEGPSMRKDKEGNNILRGRESSGLLRWEDNGRVESRRVDLGTTVEHLGCHVEKMLSFS